MRVFVHKIGEVGNGHGDIAKMISHGWTDCSIYPGVFVTEPQESACYAPPCKGLRGAPRARQGRDEWQ